MKARAIRWYLAVLMWIVSAAWSYAILAGHENYLPADMPSLRIDVSGASSPFNFVGALSMQSDGRSYIGSAAALSPNWVLTAGHNVDFNDDGAPDDGLTINFHLPGFTSYTSTSVLTYPGFTGFGNPAIHHDLALLFFDDPLPVDLAYPALGLSAGIGDVITLTGFGRSGFGSYGYTTSASLTDRRIGSNTLAAFETETNGEGLLFRYDFDPPDGVASLGNDVETIIGPGDSGGPALFPYDDRYALFGVNTFTEGYGGRFGDIGGGVALDPYWGWISETTGLALVPEPMAAAGVLGVVALFLVFVRRSSVSWRAKRRRWEDDNRSLREANRRGPAK